MLHLLPIAAHEAIRTLRANPMHTLLSTLGIIIGVGALVAILSLGDGMERFGRDQIAGTTDLASVHISPVTNEEIDGIWMKKEHPGVLGETEAQRLDSLFKDRAIVQLETRLRGYLELLGDTLRKPAILIAGRANAYPDTLRMLTGRLYRQSDVEQKAPVIVLSAQLAGRLAPAGDTAALLGRKLRYENIDFEIIGILDGANAPKVSEAHIPASLLSAEQLRAHPPGLVLSAQVVEQTPEVKKQAEAWLDAHVPGGSKAFQIQTHEFRLEQIKKGILVFKIIMGMITGIAVLVGGIGIMNVLLMSITERTREIGIRKALGAKRSAIALQFLAESMAISLAGCLLGLALGMLFMAAAVPIVKHFAEIPFFSAAFSWGSVLVVLAVAVFIGLSFGTYPAWKASRLTPVEAIRHE